MKKGLQDARSNTDMFGAGQQRTLVEPGEVAFHKTPARREVVWHGRAI
jgi:hypothetical protein